ncbi:hypothetical protein [Streptomyces sp. NPDC054975]
MTAPEPADVVEPEEQPSKLAGGCVLAIGAALAGGVVYAVPELGYTVAGLGAATGYRRARAWALGRRKRATEEEPEAEDVIDIVATLHELSPAGALHVRLTELQEATGLPDTKAVRALLDDDEIRVRTGVRAGGKNGPGVHSDDIPRWPCGPSSEGCWCTSDANTNANNTLESDPEKGFRVEHTGQAGTTVYDLSETRRHHATTKS